MYLESELVTPHMRPRSGQGANLLMAKLSVLFLTFEN